MHWTNEGIDLRWNYSFTTISSSVFVFVYFVFVFVYLYFCFLYCALLWPDSTRELTWGGITLLQPFRALADLYDQPQPPFSRKEKWRWIWNEGRNIEWNEISKVLKNRGKGEKCWFYNQFVLGHLYDHSIPSCTFQKSRNNDGWNIGRLLTRFWQ